MIAEKIKVLAPFLVMLALIGVLPAQGEEIRAVWVCAFGPCRDEASTRAMVQECARSGVNTILFQARYRGDAMYTPNRVRSTYPNPEPPSPYRGNHDPLATCIDEAKKHGIEVHAYINYTVLASRERPEPNHPVNVHPDWLTHRLQSDGTTAPTLQDGIHRWADPGIRAVQDHLFNLTLDIVENYDIDGIHFDRVRYPEGEGWPPRLVWGYHPETVARFNANTGRTGLPEPNDEAWVRWRQGQITLNLARIATAARAIRPDLTISAAIIAFDGLEGGQRSTLQAWEDWIAIGALDVIVPMVYSRRTSGGESAVLEQSAPYRERIAQLNALRPPSDQLGCWIGLRAWMDEGTMTGEEVGEKVDALHNAETPPQGTVLFRFESASDMGILHHLGEDVWATNL